MHEKDVAKFHCVQPNGIGLVDKVDFVCIIMCSACCCYVLSANWCLVLPDEGED